MEHDCATVTAEGPPSDIIEARTEQEIAAVGRLLREFKTWCCGRYANRSWQVETDLDPNAWESELAALGERYASPDGALLLARCGMRSAGCATVRQIQGGLAEMKYLYVRPQYRAMGLGRRLTEAGLAWARAHRCRALRLEAGDLQHEALALYGDLGFHEIAPYHPVPGELAAHLVFLEAAL
jgi:GNAT superfamily N-acetyltransferase